MLESESALLAAALLLSQFDDPASFLPSSLTHSALCRPARPLEAVGMNWEAPTEREGERGTLAAAGKRSFRL